LLPPLRLQHLTGSQKKEPVHKSLLEVACGRIVESGGCWRKAAISKSAAAFGAYDTAKLSLRIGRSISVRFS
jgi:hypothetical protein